MRIEQVIGRNVKAARTEAGLSQDALARKLTRWLGGKPWSRQAVSAAEAGKRAFVAVELIALGFVLKKPVAAFFRTENEIEMPSGAKVAGRAVFGQIAMSADPLERLENIGERADAAREAMRKTHHALRQAYAAVGDVAVLTGTDKRLLRQMSAALEKEES